MRDASCHWNRGGYSSPVPVFFRCGVFSSLKRAISKGVTYWRESKGLSGTLVLYGPVLFFTQETPGYSIAHVLKVFQGAVSPQVLRIPNKTVMQTGAGRAAGFPTGRVWGRLQWGRCVPPVFQPAGVGPIAAGGGAY